MKIRWWIIASGPSLTPEDVNRLKGEKVCVINNNYQLAPWAAILYACDLQWWDWFDGAKDFAGEKWTRDPDAAPKYGLNYIKSKAGSGLTDDGVIFEGCNSGIQAINLIWHLYHPDQICLLGYDMQGSKDNPHWHGHHPNKVVSQWSRWIRWYEILAEDAEKKGLEVINCTRQTALTCFRRESLESALSLAPVLA